VFLVMGSMSGPRAVNLLLDGHPLAHSVAGSDAERSSATVSFQRLYRLVELPTVQRHVLTIQPGSGTTVYSFTFG